MSDQKSSESMENQEEVMKITLEEETGDVSEDSMIITDESMEITDEATQDDNAGVKKEKKHRMSNARKSISSSFASKKFKGGAYATIVSVVVIALVMVVNLIVSELGIKIDLTDSGQYTLKDDTINFVKDIADDVTLYYMVETGAETTEIQELVDKYDSITGNVSVVHKDPVLYPKFVSQYIEGEETVDSESVLVVNETTGRAKLVGYDDMITTSYDYTTYESTTTSDIEGQIDSALQYVTNEDLPVMYSVSGHGETAVTTTLASTLAKENVTQTDFETLTAEAIPEDCDILFINSPANDYTEDEVTMIKNYLIAGGDAIIVMNNAVTSELPIFSTLLSYYGIDIVPGIVVEGDSNYYRGTYAVELLPSVTTHELTSGVKGKKYVDVVYGVGLTVRDDIRSTITATSLLTTSDKSYSKVDLNSSTVSKEDADIDGPFSVAMLIEETYNDVDTKLAVYSGLVFDDSFLTTTTYGNGTLLMNTINYMAGVENTLSIPTQDLSSYETVSMTSAQIRVNGLICLAVLPVLTILLGIFVVVRRRKK